MCPGPDWRQSIDPWGHSLVIFPLEVWHMRLVLFQGVLTMEGLGTWIGTLTDWIRSWNKDGHRENLMSWADLFVRFGPILLPSGVYCIDAELGQTG